VAPATVLGLLSPAAPAAADVEPLKPFRVLTIEGGIAAAGTCIAANAIGGPDGGTIDLTTLPPGAVVLEAFLYYSVLHPMLGVPPGSPTMNAAPLLPVPLGEVPRSPCFEGAGQNATGSFRADVTALVTGNGSYVLAGFPTSPSFTEGATLAVIYCQEGLPATDVVLYDGIDVVNATVVEHTQTLTGFSAGAAPSSTWLALLGNGQRTDARDRDPLSFNGIDVETFIPTTEVLYGSACAVRADPGGFWDLGLYDVSAQLTSGATSVPIALRWFSDCYSVLAYALAVTTDGPADPCSIPQCPAPPGRIVDLKGVKSLPSDVVFSWDQDPGSSGGYRLYTVAVKTDLQLPVWPSVRALECSGLFGQETCTDAGALPPPPTLLFYQAVGVCGDGSTEGPPL
jgi:hypothetical protein